MRYTFNLSICCIAVYHFMAFNFKLSVGLRSLCKMLISEIFLVPAPCVNVDQPLLAVIRPCFDPDGLRKLVNETAWHLFPELVRLN